MLNRSYIFPFFISLSGYVFMVSMDTIIKVLGSNYPILQLLFLNALFSLIPLTFFIIKNHGVHFYLNQNYKFQFIRGIIHTLGFLFVLMGVLKLPLSVVYPVLFSSPLMLLIMSHFFLNENINIIRISAIILGFFGVLISAEPFGSNVVSIMGILLVFVGAFCIALTNLITRKYSALSSSFSASFFSMVISVIAFLFAMKFSFVPMTFEDLMLSMFGGIIAGLGISSIVYGSRMLPASIYGMTSYFQLIYGVIFGWFIFQQLPTTFNYIGIILVFLAGIILFAFDKQKA
ncbi:DMT family transporter [Alphaproteobacteria bacterium]|nr:DMT family transporter [Alphaproteobacteria bacterium]